MKNADGVLAAVTVVALLLLTAGGNARAMLVVSAILLVAGFAVLRADTFRSKLLAAVVGCVAAAVAIAIR